MFPDEMTQKRCRKLKFLQERNYFQYFSHVSLLYILSTEDRPLFLKKTVHFVFRDNGLIPEASRIEYTTLCI